MREATSLSRQADASVVDVGAPTATGDSGAAQRKKGRRGCRGRKGRKAKRRQLEGGPNNGTHKGVDPSWLIPSARRWWEGIGGRERPSLKALMLAAAVARGRHMTELLCPLSNTLLVDPVVAADGHTYDRQALFAWAGLRDPGTA